ncbi:LuxR C-terminal-related transcriptional regulator [Paraburkholderia saeva]|nr:LuxR C-terminal-related transcriptional regulator [Paraburkholderia saeva]
MPASHLAPPATGTIQTIASKLAPRTAATQLVARKRILDTLQLADGAKLVLVRAPAGFGKTSVLVEHFHALQRAGIATAWLTLDAGDNEVARFIAHMLAAFGAVDPSLAQATMSSDAPEAGMPVAAMHLVQQVSAQTAPFALFVDNLDVIHNTTVLGMLRMLLDTLPIHGQMLICSRATPDLGLARLRAHGHLLEIGATTLRFSVDEARELLRDRGALTLSEDQVGRLHQRTEGWAAGLWLAALALRERQDPDTFVASFTGSSADVADYLLDDVLSRQPDPTRRFLIDISVLDDLRPAPCDVLTGRNDSRELLSTLERSGLFIVPQGQGRDSWRFHPLFREFLQAQLGAAEAAALHAAASRWHAAQGQPVPAIEHAIRGGLNDIATELLAQHAEPLLWEGRVRLLGRLFDSLPAAVRCGLAPQLALIFGWMLIFTQRYGEALALIERLESLPAATDDLAVITKAQRALLLTMTWQLDGAKAIWEQTLGQIPAATQPFAHGLQHSSYAFCLIATDRFDSALEAAAAGMPSHHRTGSSFNIALAACLESEVHLTQGRAGQAIERARAVLSTGTAHPGQHVSGSTVAAAFLADALYAANELPEAKRLLDTYLPMISDIGSPEQIITSYRCLARIALQEDNPARATALLNALEAIGARHAMPRIARSVWIERSRIAVLGDDAEAAAVALRHAQESGCREIGDGWATGADDVDSLQIATLRLQVHASGASAALSLLRDAIRDAEGRGRLRRAHQLRILLALALQLSGDLPQALRCLRVALTFAEAGRLMRSFADEGPAVLRLLSKLRPGAELETNPPLKTESEHPMPLIDALTGTETKVVRLVAEGQGNKLIAQQLCVSEATVKTHLRSINSKLGATNRTHAVALARRLGLLGAG